MKENFSEVVWNFKGEEGNSHWSRCFVNKYLLGQAVTVGPKSGLCSQGCVPRRPTPLNCPWPSLTCILCRCHW